MTEPGDREVQPATGEQRIGSVSSVEQLVAARQARGLGASDIAAKLGMTTRQIEAIESGSWQALPGHAFVRGALRAYGKTVGVDIQPLLATLGGQVRAPELRASASLDSAMPRGGSMSSGGSLGRMAWILVGVVAVIAMAFYFSRPFESGGSAMADASSSSRNADRGASQAGSASAPGDASAGVRSPAGERAADARGSTAPLVPLAPLAPLAPMTPAGGAASDATSGASRNDALGAGVPAQGVATPTAGTPSVALASPSGAGAGAAQSPSQASRPATSSPGSAAGSGVETLHLHFERDSWVDIREADGAVLLFGIQPAGSSRELKGRKPFTFTLGNAQYVSLERAGKPVDLSARSRQGVARFTLD